MHWKVGVVLLAGFVLLGQVGAPILAQDCTSTDYAQLLASYEDLFSPSLSEADAAERSLQLAVLLQERVFTCGYVPTVATRDAQIRATLSFATLKDIIKATSIGSDTDAAVTQIADLMGDSFNGDLLYNGLVDGLDGSALGCAGCHNAENAPGTAGTWTRVDEIRLQDPALAGYDDVRYLVESILHPNVYIVAGYNANLMPDNFGNRLDAQQLADLVAYLQSQDQLLDETPVP